MSAESAAAYAALLETLYALADSDNYVRDMQICKKLHMAGHCRVLVMAACFL